MEIQTLKAEVRPLSGKGPARQLRMKGLMPAVIYGPGREATNLAISPANLTKCLTTAWGRNQLIELDIDGKKELAIVKDVETSPVSRELLHADFYAVSKERAITVKVPFEAKGRAIGVQMGGILHVIYRTLPVLCTPDKVPAKIEVDVSTLNLHQSIKVKDIKLADGVSIDLPQERPLVAVETKAKEVAEDETAVAGAPVAGAVAGAKDAKAAPAAKDAKAAAPAAAKKK